MIFLVTFSLAIRMELMIVNYALQTFLTSKTFNLLGFNRFQLQEEQSWLAGLHYLFAIICWTLSNVMPLLLERLYIQYILLLYCMKVELEVHVDGGGGIAGEEVARLAHQWTWKHGRKVYSTSSEWRELD